MGKKKIFMSVTASAVIASSLVHAQQVDASSYTVKQGDSLWSISQKYETTVTQLKAWNNLSSDLIRPNQVLKVSSNQTATSNNSTSSTKNNSSTKQTGNNVSTYTVVKGDTLSAIAAKHRISLTNLMKWNNLDTTLIFPGDKLKVSASSSSNSSNNNSTSSSPNTNNSSSATYYTVKSGDNLSKIAAQHGISLNNLKKWNKLTSDLIYPGDRLIVSNNGTSSNANNQNSTNNSSNSNQSNHSNSSSNNSNTTYTVKAGDNLSKIAAQHGISLNNLKKWNNLTSHLIYPGDVLVVNGSETSNNNGQSSGSNSGSTNNVDKLIDIARSALGTKYAWAGSSLSSGFDCSGFIYWAFNEAGHKIGRYSTDGYYNRSFMINKPEVGDLVFFENTYKQGISHMGIYLGGNNFIHADSSGVTISNLNNSYWNKHFHSFKKFY